MKKFNFERVQVRDPQWVKALQDIKRPNEICNEFIRANIAEFGTEQQREMLMSDVCALVRIALARYGSRDMCMRLFSDDAECVVNAARYFLDRKPLEKLLCA